MTPIRVLLADDHAILRQGIRALLEGDPEIEVVGEASDGREAVDAALRLRPDMAVMDIGMPGMNGIEATRHLAERLPACRVLILTMHDNPEYVRSVLAAGAAGYVLKRSVVQDLVAAIKAVHHGQAVVDPNLARTILTERAPAPRPSTAPEDADGARPPDPLTDREREVLVLIARGLSNQAIATRLVISIKTVQAHRTNIMLKLDLHDAVELTKYALRHGLIRLDED